MFRRFVFLGTVACLLAALLIQAGISLAAESPERGFEPPTLSTPVTTIPEGAVAGPDGLAVDEAAALAAADAATAAAGEGVAPVAARLPAAPLGIEPANPDPVREPPHLAPALGDEQLTSGCVGNCYQSDRAYLTDYPNDVYAFDYYYWMRTPQNNETNRCDSSSHSSGCFWFTMGNHFMDCCNSSMHTGPKRGSSASGVAGSNWRMNVSGYNNGQHIGGQGSINLPIGTWVRVRTWRTATGNDSWAPYTPWSTWGVWGLWGGTDRYMGSLTIDGHWFTSSVLAMEVYESNGQCATDFVGVYMDNPRYWSSSQGYRSFPGATADYEANCSNTSWSVIIAPDYIHDGREVTRVIADGAAIW